MFVPFKIKKIIFLFVHALGLLASMTFHAHIQVSMLDPVANHSQQGEIFP